MRMASNRRSQSLRELIPSEHEEQSSYFKFVDREAQHDERYENIYAVANGGHRHKAVAAKLKREGVKRGVLDVSIDYPMSGADGRGIPGARIEFKKQGEKTSPQQDLWIVRLQRAGFVVAVAYSWEQAAAWTRAYFGGGLIAGELHILRR